MKIPIQTKIDIVTPSKINHGLVVNLVTFFLQLIIWHIIIRHSMTIVENYNDQNDHKNSYEDYKYGITHSIISRIIETIGALTLTSWILTPWFTIATANTITIGTSN